MNVIEVFDLRTGISDLNNLNINRDRAVNIKDSILNSMVKTLKSELYLGGESTTNLQDSIYINTSIKVEHTGDTLWYVVDEVDSPLSPSKSLTQEIEQIFRNKLIEKGLPHIFLIKSIARDSSDQETVVIDMDFDRLSAHSSVAVFSEYQYYLVRQNMSQIIMSILLFALLAGAFYLIYHSWNEQLRLNQIKTEFVSNMTHELKTPISTVAVAIEALTDFDAIKNPEKTKEYLSISKHELNRLTLLVDKVLKMSRFDSDKPVLKRQSLNLQALIDEILRSMVLHFEKNNVQVNYEVIGQGHSISGDQIHITNVIYNLLDNAIKYSPKQRSIDIKLDKTNTDIILSVKDQGIGIPAKHIPAIFDRFYRVPTNDKHDVKGYGLGLSYVNEIITQHQGTITVNSKVGEGTTILISLPKSVKHD